MSEMITHVPSQTELEKWSATRKAELSPESVGNFAFGGAESAEMKDYFSTAIEKVRSATGIDTETRHQAAEVLKIGELDGHTIGMDDVNRNVVNEWDERTYIARLLIAGPEGKAAAEAIAEKGICGFHSTRSQALAGILESGKLMAASRVEENDQHMVTGEHIYQGGNDQAMISFSNLAETKQSALNYAGYHGVKERDHQTLLQDMRNKVGQLSEYVGEDTPFSRVARAYARRHEAAIQHIEENPESLFAILSKHEFPVMLGISKEYVLETERTRQKHHLLQGVASLGEFRPADDIIPLDALPVIAVPEEVIAPVTELFRTYGYPDTKVVSFEAMVA